MDGLLRGAALAALALTASPCFAGCETDQDCKGDRICEDGECVFPDARSCSKDTDCPGDQVCVQLQCSTPAPTAPAATPSVPSTLPKVQLDESQRTRHRKAARTTRIGAGVVAGLGVAATVTQTVFVGVEDRSQSPLGHVTLALNGGLMAAHIAFGAAGLGNAVGLRNRLAGDLRAPPPVALVSGGILYGVQAAGGTASELLFVIDSLGSEQVEDFFPWIFFLNGAISAGSLFLIAADTTAVLNATTEIALHDVQLHVTPSMDGATVRLTARF